MDLIYTDKSKADIGVLVAAKADMAYGSGENAFTVELPRDHVPSEFGEGSLVYAEGEEWGGRVTRIRSITEDGIVVFGGRTWHGMLADRVIRPDAGTDYLTVSGEANAVLTRLVSRLGLTDTFAVSFADSGIQLTPYSFERFTSAYSGISAMLSKNGGKLKISSESPKPVLSAHSAIDYSEESEFDADLTDIDAQVNYLPVNHLVCAGTGELKDRITLDLYADRDGSVSRTQTLFGDDLVEEYYDYPNADAEELEKKGRERLSGYQHARSGDLVLNPLQRYDVGDIVGRSDAYTEIEIASRISKAILRLGDSESVTYELGETVVSHSSSGVAESSGGSLPYLAGKNIAIAGRTISAEVGLADLASVEDIALTARTDASNASATAAEAKRTADGAAPSSHSHGSATASAAGFLSQTDKAKLDGMQEGANDYVLPTAGTSLGGVKTTSIVSSASGYTPVPIIGGVPYYKDTNTTYGNMTGATTAAPGASGLVPAPVASAANQYLRNDGTWQVPPDTDTVYSHPTTPGNKHVPSGGSPGQILRWSSDGTVVWGTDNNTTYGVATTKVAGLVKVDGVTVKVAADGTISAEQGGAASFLASHPVGSYFETEKPGNPSGDYGGTWVEIPSLGAYKWKRLG